MELYIEPIKLNRNPVTGRYLRGATPHNKGKTWNSYTTEDYRIRALENLKKGRGGWHKTGGGTNKKSVVAIKDGKLCGVFSSIQKAGAITRVSASLISYVCNKRPGRRSAGGFQWFFESDNSWCDLIK